MNALTQRAQGFVETVWRMPDCDSNDDVIFGASRFAGQGSITRIGRESCGLV